MTSQYFTYNKAKVIQALRYHFISRREIKVMMIMVNVFAIASAILFYLKKVHPLAFLVSSLLWFVLMIVFWYLMPQMVYRRAQTFKDRLRAVITPSEFRIENERGGRSWAWGDFSTWMESPHFFHLYFTSRSFFIVPKEAFEGDDVHAARRMFADNIKK
jgi:hypothetical protein